MNRRKWLLSLFVIKPVLKLVEPTKKYPSYNFMHVAKITKGTDFSGYKIRYIDMPTEIWS